MVLLQRGTTGDHITPDDVSSPLFHETQRGSRDPERVVLLAMISAHDHEEESGETIKLPNEVVSSRFVEPAIIWVPTIDDMKGVFP